MTATDALPERLTTEELRLRRGRWSAAQLRALPATVDLETACSVVGMGLWKGRHLVAEGTFPVRVIRHGSRYVVPTAALLRLLDVDKQVA